MNSDDLINNVRPIYLGKTTTVREAYSKISNEKRQSLIRLVYDRLRPRAVAYVRCRSSVTSDLDLCESKEYDNE